MNSREKVQHIFDLRSQGEVAFWTGTPWEQTTKGYLQKLGLKDPEELLAYLHDDCRHICPEWDGSYKHPEGKAMFDPLGGRAKESLSQPGCLADAETVADVERIEWPNADYLDFSATLARIGQHPDKAIFTGMWSPFFHYVSDYFGMEEYFIKMHTHPAVVEAATDKILNFYLDANRLFFEAAKGQEGIFFFGNDFGSQLDLLISPEDFRRFVLPGFKKLINLAHSFGRKTLLHSCGSIFKVIPWLIDAGMDGLHPLQAKAEGMDAANLARNFKGKVAFVGGIDTQHLLIHATPSQIKDEVRRLRDLLGPNWIVSPSHEAILPNVPLENVIAMAQAAKE